MLGELVRVEYQVHVFKIRSSSLVLESAFGEPNAAPEWQAGGLWGKSRQLLEACPLEGLVRRLQIHLSSPPQGHLLSFRNLQSMPIRAWLLVFVVEAGPSRKASAWYLRYRACTKPRGSVASGSLPIPQAR